MYLEELEHVCDGDGDDARRRAYDAGDPLQPVRLVGGRGASVGAQLPVVIRRAQVRPDELERLLEGERVPQARVEDVAAEPDARQQRRVRVDPVYGVEHRLSSLDPLLAFDRAADLQRCCQHAIFACARKLTEACIEDRQTPV